MSKAAYWSGPQFVDFLETEGIEQRNLTKSESRRWAEWKNGSRVEAMSKIVDGLLTRYGLPHSAVPEDIDAADQSHAKPETPKRGCVSQANRWLAEDLIAEGEADESISKITGIRTQTIGAYRKMLDHNASNAPPTQQIGFENA